MKRIIKDIKGAITVMVSLLLIPTVLISGTAVDLARIHTARSIVQDANQLAANSLLTQYDAMLKDIYGLYGIMAKDMELGKLLDDYIKITVFGDNSPQGLGTFQLFYGADIDDDKFKVDFNSNQNLAEPDVLRRQIEEYAKFRAPVLIVKEILAKIDQFKTIKADSDAIKKKLEIDEKVEEIDEIYEDIYKKIKELNEEYPKAEKDALDMINAGLNKVGTQLRNLLDARNRWRSAYNSSSPYKDDDMRAYEEQFDAIRQNINKLVRKAGGGTTASWILGHRDYDAEMDANGDFPWIEGRWGSSGSLSPQGLEQTMDDHRGYLRDYLTKLDELVTAARKAERKKGELKNKLEEFENQLNSGNCSAELVDAMNTPQKDEEGTVKNSVIESYRALLKYNVEEMANRFKNRNTPQIDNIREILDTSLERVVYGRIDSNYQIDTYNYISRTELKNLPNSSNSVFILSATSDKLNVLAGLTSGFHYNYDPNKFKLFQDSTFPAEHRQFFDMLEEKYRNADNGNNETKKRAKKAISELMKKAQEKFGPLLLNPDGAKYYSTKDESDSEGFGTDGDWGKEDNKDEKSANRQAQRGLNSLGDLLGGIADKILLVAYGGAMFSNYTSEEDAVTMSGVPLSIDVNYFYESEVEYLFNGNQGSARLNLAAVSGLLLLTRFVFNYISTFIISEVNTELTSISATAGPFAPLVRELLRLAYALVESVFDLSKLLKTPSEGVPLLKTQFNQWSFSIAGTVINTLEDVVLDNDKAIGASGDGVIVYIDYLRVFLLFVPGDVIATRIADLIKWNITNKKNSLGSESNGGAAGIEERMKNATLFDMSEAKTGFTITTEAEMRLLFLSMPYAQNTNFSIKPPKTMRVLATDYRGY